MHLLMGKQITGTDGKLQEDLSRKNVCLCSQYPKRSKNQNRHITAQILFALITGETSVNRDIHVIKWAGFGPILYIDFCGIKRFPRNWQLQRGLVFLKIWYKKVNSISQNKIYQAQQFFNTEIEHQKCQMQRKKKKDLFI